MSMFPCSWEHYHKPGNQCTYPPMRDWVGKVQCRHTILLNQPPPNTHTLKNAILTQRTWMNPENEDGTPSETRATLNCVQNPNGTIWTCAVKLSVPAAGADLEGCGRVRRWDPVRGSLGTGPEDQKKPVQHFLSFLFPDYRSNMTRCLLSSLSWTCLHKRPARINLSLFKGGFAMCFVPTGRKVMIPIGDLTWPQPESRVVVSRVTVGAGLEKKKYCSRESLWSEERYLSQVVMTAALYCE